jgi:hypothetical protein
MPFDRITCLMLLLASQGVVAPASAELAWPELCARLEAAGERQPDEVRRYRLLLNDEPAGQEVFRFWREGARIRVLVETSLEGDVLMFSADLRHCRDERWQEEAGALELLELESATHSAVPFRPDYEIHIERDHARGDMVYRGASDAGSFEERHPANTGATTPWSVRTVGYDRLLDLFAQAAYPIESRLVGRATVDGKETAHYAIGGEWQRHLWYQEGKLIRVCGAEPFGTYIETILEAYADRAAGALELDRPCAELFE